jgi:predicted DNA binding protein
MPEATLKIRSNEGLIALSDAHPDARFEVLGAWPDEDHLRVLVETTALGRDQLGETLASIPTISDVAFRHDEGDRVLFEANTPAPEPHGAMADSGVVPSFPLRLEDGWFVGDLTASREQLAAFRDELEAGGIDYRLVRIASADDGSTVLTERQREVVELALDRGYYETPRACTLAELAEQLAVDKSVVSRLLNRAEGRLVRAHLSDE